MKQIYILFALLFVFNGCEKDEITHSNIQQGDLLSIQKQFSLADFKDEFIKDNLKIDWSGVQEINQDETAFEFTTNLNSSLQNDQNSLFYKYQLAAYKNNDGWDFELVKFTSFDAANLGISTVAHLEDFTGTLSKFNLYGEMIEISAYEDGEVISSPKKDKSTGSYKYAPPIAPGPCTGCNWVMIFTERWMDYYAIGSEGSEYLGSFLISRTNEWVYVPNDGAYNTGFGDYAGGNNYHDHFEDGPHGPSQTSENHPVEILIDPSINEYPCLAEVLNKILISDSELFKETIGRFMDNPKYDITFTVGECKRTDNACTDGEFVDETGEIFVKIEDTDQNPIDFAAMILHEGIHAEIFRYVNEHHEGYVDPNDKPQLFEYYQYYKTYSNKPTKIDHIYMTQYYITPIAEALRELDNNQYPLNYYKSFAWDGLRKYDPNNSLGMVDEEYSQYRNEVTVNFNIKCNE